MNRPYAGFDLHTTPFLIHCGMLDVRDVGRLVRNIQLALLNGDDDALRDLPFVCNLAKGPRAHACPPTE